MSNIITGVIVIVIGICNGGSIFTGNPTPIDYLFDIGGSLLIIWGVIKLISGGGDSD